MMPGWLKAAWLMFAAALAEYWHAAPGVMKAATMCMPLAGAVDMTAALVRGKLCPGDTVADRWQAVTYRMMLTTAFVILGFTADAVAGIPYSFVALALVWGYGSHVGSAIRHLRKVAALGGVGWPPWADELDDRAGQIVAGGLRGEDEGNGT